VALALTRQGMPVLDRNTFGPAAGLSKGAYVLKDAGDKKPGIILIATGSEVQIALDASQELESKGMAVRVVSMPSWELFERQPQEYKDEVLPPETKARISIEAGVPHGWRQYVGDRGEIIAINRFGASAPYKVLYEKFGITPQRVVEKALAMSGRAEP
jgi:transketolase